MIIPNFLNKVLAELLFKQGKTDGMRIVFKILIISLVLMTSACKSKKVVNDKFIATPVAADKVIKNYRQNTFRQNTVKARIKVDFKDDKSEQSFTANLRMEKDKSIWITATVLGIPLVKALITPEKVSYYEKINETYFEGDFSVLSNWLGTSLDFEKVQNLLLGQVINSLDVKGYDVIIDENAHLFKSNTNQDDYSFLFWINPQHFRLNRQVAIQPDKNQLLSIVYKKYEVVQNDYFPTSIFIEAIDSTKTTKIELDFKGIEFNEPLSFPFEIPSGYKPVRLN